MFIKHFHVSFIVSQLLNLSFDPSTFVSRIWYLNNNLNPSLTNPDRSFFATQTCLSSFLLPASSPPLSLFPPRTLTYSLSHHVSHLQNLLLMHARTPAHGTYVFSQNKIPNTRSECVLLGDKSAPPPPPLCTKIKTHSEVAGSVYTPRSIAHSRGYWLWRALAVHLPSRLSARCMLAGPPPPLPPPPPLTALARQGGCRGSFGVGGVGGGGDGEGRRLSDRGKKTAGGALALDSCPPCSPRALTEGEPRPLDPPGPRSCLSVLLQGESSCLPRLASVWGNPGLSQWIFSGFAPWKSPLG